MVLNMALQLPHILKTIRQEHRVLQQLVQQHAYRVVISDNRYGCFAQGTKNIFITHQVQPIVPAPLRLPLSVGLGRFYRNFDELWVPDCPGAGNLSGKLSAARPPKTKVRYIGPLTRMQPLALEPRWDVIAVLSGPEPQRSRLEAELLKQAAASPLKWLIVQGRPDTAQRSLQTDRLQVVPFMDSQSLNRAICRARFYVGRSGYSSLMDLAALKVPALLVPTPGQTEQEYLAQRMQRLGCALTQKQTALKVLDAYRQRTRLKPWPGPAAGNLDDLMDALE